MKRFIFLLLMILAFCGCQSQLIQSQSMGKVISESESVNVDENTTNITLTISDSVFSAKLYDTETSTAFLTQLPMTVNMRELNGNEKYYNMADSLPADSQSVPTINTGDLMLYGSDCLVLFYQSFPTSYSYTRLGYIENTSGLAEALGGGNAQITFAIED